MAPRVRYARRGDLHVAYAVIGDGPIDVVFVPGSVSNLHRTLDPEGWPTGAAWLERMSRFARVITFDQIGTGLSDRIHRRPRSRGSHGRCAGGDGRGRLGAGRARGLSLTVVRCRSCSRRRFPTVSTRSRCSARSPRSCGPMISPGCRPRRNVPTLGRSSTTSGAPAFAWRPSCPPDEVTEENIEHLAAAETGCASPGAVIRLEEMDELIDVRAVLSTISVPTLVVHATGDETVPFASATTWRSTSQRPVPSHRLPAHLSFCRPPARSSTGSTTSRSSSPACGRLASRTACSRPCCTPTSSTRPHALRRSATPSGRQLLDRHDRLVGREIDRYRGSPREVDRRRRARAFRRPGTSCVVRPLDRRRRTRPRTARFAPDCTPARSSCGATTSAASPPMSALGSRRWPRPTRCSCRAPFATWSRAPG